jgi:hypothetical protein
MPTMNRGAVAGTVMGVLVVAVLGVGLASGLIMQRRAVALDSAPAPVLVVFTGHAESGARVSAFTFVVKPTGAASLIDPSSQLSLPGVSATTVGDASAFAGAQDIAAAIGAGAAHWAEFPETEWVAALAASGPVSVDVPEAVDTFDGHQVHSYRAGPQVVLPEDVSHLANAAQFLPADERAVLLGSLARAVITSVAATSSPARARSDMSAEALSAQLGRLAAEATFSGLASPAGGAR